MFDIKPSTIQNVVETLGKQSSQLVKQLDETKDAQKVIVGQQQGLLNVLAGAGIALGAMVIHQKLQHSDAPDTIEVHDKSDEASGQLSKE